MFANHRSRFSLSAAVLVLLLSTGAADAAWITIKNDTTRVVVIQSSVGSTGQVRRGRPARLLPGESTRELVAPQSIVLEVYDAKAPNKPILTSRLAIKKENQVFSIAAGSSGVVVAPLAAK